MNEGNNPRLHWFEVECGNIKIGTWATSEREARKVAARCGYKPSKPQNRYGHSTRSMAGIVI